MSNIYAVNSNLSVTQKIILLNQMILELNGMISGGTFDKNELDAIYNNLFLSRQYIRHQGLGNSLTTYPGWTDISDQQGYSIWKYTPSNYSYSTNNQVYFDGQVFNNRGLAFSESTSSFNNVYLFESDSHPGYVNEINAGQTNQTTSFYVMASTLDFLYLGSSSTFGGFNINWKIRGAGYTLVVQYWTGTAWVTMGPANNLVDDTNSFQSMNGIMTWNVPLNWNKTTVNSVNQYWIRISTSTNPSVTGLAYYCIPATSAVALLALSTADITDDNWSWCTYNGNVYITLPNTGGFGGEGNTFIKGSSTTNNLQNFFIYNNPITADYASSLYNPVQQITTSSYSISSTDSIMLVYATSPTTLTLPSAVGVEGKQYTVKHAGGGSNVTLHGASGNNIDGSGTYALNAVLSFVTVVSDGENWYIINAGTA